MLLRTNRNNKNSQTHLKIFMVCKIKNMIHSKNGSANFKILLSEIPDGLEGLVKTQHLFIKTSGLPIESLFILFHIFHTFHYFAFLQLRILQTFAKIFANYNFLLFPYAVYSSLETQYEVLNSDGEKIFMADESTDTTTKAWCRGTKPFDVSILIRSGKYRKEVIKMDGEPRSCGCGGVSLVKLSP